MPEGADRDEQGLETLRSIARIGLLFVPEFISFDEVFSNGTVTPVTIGQKRICLSDIEPPRLFEHSQTFGRFSIEWSHAVALEMGAVPAFYFPEVTPGAPGFTNLTGTLIARLAETVSLLSTLDEVLSASRAGDSTKPLLLHQVETNEDILLDTSSTFRLLEYINLRYRGFAPLAANIRGLAQLFCPTHNSQYGEPLTYYRQREWRIISDISMGAVANSRDLTDAEKREIAALNPAFFLKEIDAFTGRHRRIDLCRAHVNPGGPHPLSSASAVVVPLAAVARAEKLLADEGFSVPIRALEDSSYGYLQQSFK
jgi:Putative abortive phage resistance protein AbiGi, antitoxin